MSRTSLWGVWDPVHGLDTLALDKWEMRRDLSDITFTTATAHEAPYVESRDIDMNILESYDLPRGYRVLALTYTDRI